MKLKTGTFKVDILANRGLSLMEINGVTQLENYPEEDEKTSELLSTW